MESIQKGGEGTLPGGRESENVNENENPSETAIEKQRFMEAVMIGEPVENQPGIPPLTYSNEHPATDSNDSNDSNESNDGGTTKAVEPIDPELVPSIAFGLAREISNLPDPDVGEDARPSTATFEEGIPAAFEAW